MTVILLARQRLPACYLSAAGRRWLCGTSGPTGAAGVSAPPKRGCSDPPPSRPLGRDHRHIHHPHACIFPFPSPPPPFFFHIIGAGGGAPLLRQRIHIHKGGFSPSYFSPSIAGFSEHLQKEIVIWGDNSHISGDNNF